MKRLLDWLAALMLCLFVVWVCLPSSMFIRTVSMTVDGAAVRFIRETPFGGVRASWVSEITLANGQECNSGSWRQAYYQEQPGNLVTYELGAWAAPCIEAGPPYYMTTTRMVWLFDVIPLRPDRTRVEVLGDDPAVLILPIVTEE